MNRAPYPPAVARAGGGEAPIPNGFPAAAPDGPPFSNAAGLGGQHVNLPASLAAPSIPRDCPAGAHAPRRAASVPAVSGGNFLPSTGGMCRDFLDVSSGNNLRRAAGAPAHFRPRGYVYFTAEERNQILDRWAAGGITNRGLGLLFRRPEGSIATLLHQARKAGDPRAAIRSDAARRRRLNCNPVHPDRSP